MWSFWAFSLRNKHSSLFLVRKAMFSSTFSKHAFYNSASHNSKLHNGKWMFNNRRCNKFTLDDMPRFSDKYNECYGSQCDATWSYNFFCSCLCQCFLYCFFITKNGFAGDDLYWWKNQCCRLLINGERITSGYYFKLNSKVCIR